MPAPWVRTLVVAVESNFALPGPLLRDTTASPISPATNACTPSIAMAPAPSCAITPVSIVASRCMLSKSDTFTITRPTPQAM
eukprot:624006-Prymnesium_polylepis.1